MVVIRLARTGSKKNPYYHVVVADKRMPRDGRFIENIGYFNPMARGQSSRLELKSERVTHWVNQGAQPSERVSHLIKEFAKVGTDKARPAAPSNLDRRAEQSANDAKAAKKKMEVEAKAAAAAEKEAEKPAEEATPAEDKAE